MQTTMTLPKAVAPFGDATGLLAAQRPRKASVTILLILASLVIGQRVTPARADADDFCAKVRNDDRLRPYDPGMRPDFVRAFRKLFPDMKGGQSDAMLREEAHFRCMNGKLVACFTGANLPCAKINPARDNPGAEAFCRDHRETPDVPRAATGHGVAFTYRCHAGHAEVSGTAWTLDDRGFAKDVWTPLDLD